MAYVTDQALQIRRRHEEAYLRDLESQYSGIAGMSGLLQGNGMGMQQARQAFNHDRSVAAVPDQKPNKLLLLL